MIANSLQAIVTQTLLPTADGTGRVAALEILLPDDAVRNLVRQAKVEQVYTIMQTNTSRGMQTMEQALADLVLRRVVAASEALACTSRPDQLAGILERAGHVARRGARPGGRRRACARAPSSGGGVVSDSIWKKEISLRRKAAAAPRRSRSSVAEPKQSVWKKGDLARPQERRRLRLRLLVAAEAEAVDLEEGDLALRQAAPAEGRAPRPRGCAVGVPGFRARAGARPDGGARPARRAPRVPHRRRDRRDRRPLARRARAGRSGGHRGPAAGRRLSPLCPSSPSRWTPRLRRRPSSCRPSPRLLRPAAPPFLPPLSPLSAEVVAASAPPEPAPVPELVLPLPAARACGGPRARRRQPEPWGVPPAPAEPDARRRSSPRRRPGSRPAGRPSSGSPSSQPSPSSLPRCRSSLTPFSSPSPSCRRAGARRRSRARPRARARRRARTGDRAAAGEGVVLEGGALAHRQAPEDRCGRAPLALLLRRPSLPARGGMHHASTRVVGLKIGSSQLAAARISNNGVAELQQVVRQELAPGIVVCGEVRDPDALATALRRFFSAEQAAAQGRPARRRQQPDRRPHGRGRRHRERPAARERDPLPRPGGAADPARRRRCSTTRCSPPRSTTRAAR